MKERPIIFSGEMVRAILDGRKTQTRRIVTPQPRPATVHPDCSPIESFHDGFLFVAWKTIDHHDRDDNSPFKSPYICGDRLWVREAWNVESIGEVDNGVFESFGYLEYIPEKKENGHHIIYKATDLNADEHKFRSSIHMPRWASRITLEIKNVRVERLQDIGEEDAKAEGFNSRDELKTLWDKINGKRAPWDSDPWVWVVEFERVEQ